MSQITEPGKYLARAINESVDMGLSNSGTEQISIQFALLDADGEPTDATITWIGNFKTTKSMEITSKALKATGWGGSLKDLSGIGSKNSELDVQYDEYNGERRLKVKWVNTPGGGGIIFKNKIEGSAKDALAARMDAFMKSRGEAPAAGGGAVDDLPSFP